jgi:hypothetical protein
MKPAQLARYAALGGAFLLAALVPMVRAQNQAWIRQFGTYNYDQARAAAPDGSGGVYVSGQTYANLGGTSAGASDAWIARFDSAGNQTWIRQFGSSGNDITEACAPDGSGGVYVSGATSGSLGGLNAGDYDVWLTRYDSVGSQIWIRHLGSSSIDWAYAAVPDNSGGVYVSGATTGSLGGPSAGGYDAWIARYDRAGNQTWIRQFGTSTSDEAYTAAPDGSDGVYLSGWTGGSLVGPNAGATDAWLARYDSAGNQTWIRQFGSSTWEDARASAADGSGGVYVSGWTRGNLGGPSAGDRDTWLARYDSVGSQTWIRQLGSSGDDSVSAAAPDGSGGVFVSGTTNGSLGGPHAGDYDAWLARYDSAGYQIWIRQFGTSTIDAALAAAPDTSGGVYVSGDTLESLGGPSAGYFDAWIAYYDGGLMNSRYCTPAVPNSTGQSGALTAIGSNAVQANDVTLIASSLSLNSFGFFLTSRDQGNIFPVSNSQGRLCLGGLIGRYIGAGQIKNSGTTGSFSLALNLTAMAHPFNPVVAQPGQTWYFQAWHRDANPTLTSNFTDAVSVTFQ